MKDSKAYFRGCLLGGALGDAMGFPAEFMCLEEIHSVYGEEGVMRPELNEAVGKALISDDTQMAVFTVDGLLWADSKAKRKGIYAYIPCLFYAYQKWLYTQTGQFADKRYEFLLDGEVLKWEALYARRTPGETILAALAGSIKGKYGTLRNRINNSKGYGAVVRSAPIGMYFCRDPKKAFDIGCEAGALTHGHSDGFLTAGTFASLMSLIFQGAVPEEAAMEAMAILKRRKNSGNSYETLKKAVLLSKSDEDSAKALASIGEGWVGEEALAMGLYCALKYPLNFEEAVRAAVNQDGNSNGSAAICGYILGGYLGSLEIPYSWIQDLELAELLIYGADRLLAAVIDKEN